MEFSAIFVKICCILRPLPQDAIRFGFPVRRERRLLSRAPIFVLSAAIADSFFSSVEKGNIFKKGNIMQDS
ncbi:hypothetical protein FL966_10155 [Caproiciproducens galactitolivorans]|uniref:Uncharacterized protein n=1 Tax=Caproiciproducens galactitolivorans TaxID=642589 RepID=A0A4Z0Y015_9FIRM|nr:hypothetical protein [Caproiciproducens galactitolivorans]QEY35380.1 hypothetical protein FL966_10155 [Caproiciproducens galactitolivorans]TGJ77084.1 hypothetical protein CAGA_11600 [Caproiciproducens galactitolivorans]